MEKLVITIERQAGSGGRQIGDILARKMGAKCYDEELLKLAAKESGIAEELFKAHDEKPTSSFLYSLVMDTYSMGFGTEYSMPINHQIFLAQFEAIKRLAMDESCVIVGRCADYALQDLPNMVSVFVCGEEEDKLKRAMEAHGDDAKRAKELMIKADKERSSYYNYYSGKKFGEAKSYDLCINTSTLGNDLELAADIILEFARKAIAARNES